LRYSLILVALSVAYGDCVSYTADYVGCSAEYYPSGGFSCSCAGPSRRAGLGNSPGFLVERVNQEYLIRHVLAGSPAEMRGVREGDVLLALNEIPISQALVGPAMQSWGPSTSRVLLERQGQRFELKIPLISLLSLLDRRWERLPEAAHT